MKPIQSIQRVHKKFSKPVTMYSYTFVEESSNAYADGKWTQEAQTIQASVRAGKSGNQVESDASGNEFDSMRTLFIRSDIDVNIGDGDNERADEFALGNGRTFRASELYDDGALLHVEVIEV